MPDLSWADIRHGILIGVVGAFPFVLAAQILSVVADVDADRDDEFTLALGLTLLLGLFAFVAMGVGAHAAAARQPTLPLSHGLLAALGTYALIQAVGVIRLSVVGEDIAAARIVLNGVLAAGAGLIGAQLAHRRSQRHPKSQGHRRQQRRHPT